MDKMNVLLLTSCISVFLLVFLALFLVTVNTKHKFSNVLFALFLLVTAVDIIGPVLNFWVNVPSNIRVFKNSLAFLHLPIFYLYVISVCFSDFKFKPKHLLHLLPFAIANLILIPRFYAANSIDKISFLENYKSMVELQFNHLFIHLLILGYLLAVFITLKKAKKLYLENYAGPSINSYHWLFQFTVALTVLYLIALFKNIFKFSDYPNITNSITIGLVLFQLFITCWYLFKALNNPGLFRNIHSKLQLAADIAIEDKSKNQIAEHSNAYDEDLITLNNYIAKEKPYLNPSITIQNIADDTKIPVRELSLLINHKLGKHFFDFINFYRIENAKQLLADPSKHKVTILEILYEVGFNSKSSFNTAFKKHTGLTPTTYRKQL